MRFALAISCGDRTPSMMVGMSAGSSRLRFGLERFSDLADGIAIEPRIMAAGNVQAVDPAGKQPAVCTELAAVGSSTDAARLAGSRC